MTTQQRPSQYLEGAPRSVNKVIILGLPEDCTVEDVENAYMEAWRSGAKAVGIQMIPTTPSATGPTGYSGPPYSFSSPRSPRRRAAGGDPRGSVTLTWGPNISPKRP